MELLDMKNYKIISFLLGVFLLGFTTCKKWDLEQKEFLKLELQSLEEATSNSIEIVASLDGLTQSIAAKHGFVWSDLDSLPVIGEEDKGFIGLGSKNENGTFAATIADLTPNTNYWIRSFAEINGELVYSSTNTFFLGVEIELKMLSFKAVRGTTTAEARSSLSGLGEGNVVETYGHCWSATNDRPTLEDNSSSLGITSKNIADFASKLTNLIPLTPYYVRPYARIGGAVFYGPVESIYKGNTWLEKNAGLDLSPDNRGHFTLHGKAYLLEKPNGPDQEIRLMEYDPALDYWVEKAPFPGDFRLQYAFTATSSKAYLGLGFVYQESYYNDFWEYDPLDTSLGLDGNGNPMGKWRQKNNFPLAGRREVLVFSIDEKVYIAFGARVTTIEDTKFHDIWEFDPEKSVGGEWTQLFTDCECGARFDGTTFVLNGKAYHAGGGGPYAVARLELWELDIKNTANPCALKLTNQDIERYGPASISVGDRGYFGGGIHGSGQVKSDFYEYDSKSEVNGFDVNGNPRGEWIYLGDMGTDKLRLNPMGWNLNGRIFFGFGLNDNTKDLWEYLPDE